MSSLNFKTWIALILISLNLAIFADTLDGKLLAKKYCSECHQDDGNSEDENIPKIAGFSAALTYDIIDQFKSGYRDAKAIKNENGQMTDMIKISKKLNDDEIDAISFYFEKQSFKPEKQNFNELLVETGKQLHLDFCNDCHVDLATSSDDDAPILAGQWKAYLSEQFKHFSNRERKMTRRMRKKFRKLDDNDKKALIEFYSSRAEATKEANSNQ